MVTERKVALITDGSHPSAASIAEKLESEGIIVVKNYPRSEKKGPIEGEPNSFAFDTWSFEEMSKLLEFIVEKIGNVNYLVHTV